jgi:hypothetical protein
MINTRPKTKKKRTNDPIKHHPLAKLLTVQRPILQKKTKVWQWECPLQQS